MTWRPLWPRSWMWKLLRDRSAACSPKCLATRRAARAVSVDPGIIVGEINMDIRPIHDRVLVKRLDEGEQMRGGIIIPDTAKEKPQQAEVMAVGSGKLLETGQRTSVDVKPGDRILFGKYSGSDIKLEGSEYLILREDEILGVLE